METFIGIMIPFLGTALGSACVFFMKKSLGNLVQRSLAGFAAGVMVAASIWSLLIPAIEQSEGMGKLSFLPAFIGFWVGVLFLLLLDRLIPHLHVGSNQAEGPKSRLGRTTMMVLAVTLHNIPEAMARAVAEGMTAAGAEAVLLTPAEIASGDLNAYAAIAFGCPAMGAEVLEEMEFQPMFDACKRSLGGKRVALFGSYGWGDGEWMRTWEGDCDSAGVNLVCESVICTETPDDAALEACRALGKALVE